MLRFELPAEKTRVHETVMPLRWGDMDAMGHINNTLYFRYMEVARLDWIFKLGASTSLAGEGPVIVNAFCNFLRQLEFPGDIRVALFVANPGRSSFDTYHTIERTDEPPAAFGQAYIVQPNPVLRYDLSVSYRQELPDDVSGVAVGAVDAIAYEEGRGRWEPLTILRVDRQAKLVSGLDDGVSIFYALLDDSPSEPSSEGDDSSPMATTTAETTSGTGPDDTTGSPDDTTGSSGEGESTGGSTGEPPPSFGNDVQPILDANCSCHLDAAPADLSFADAYENLVSVASTDAQGAIALSPVPATVTFRPKTSTPSPHSLFARS